MDKGKSDSKLFELANMTTKEAEEVFKKAELAIIPVGSLEQHSINMTLKTDTSLAYEVSKRIAERMYPKLIILPPIPVGVSYHHMDYVGSMTLSPDTLQHVVFDYIKSMKYHGLNRFLIINGHGGNQSTLSVASTIARYELSVHIANLFYWNLASKEINESAKSQHYGHACEIESSLGLYLDPSIVRKEDLRSAEMLQFPMKYTSLECGNGVDYPYSWKEITEDGSFGDARYASENLGEEIVEIILDRMEEFIDSFIAYTK